MEYPELKKNPDHAASPPENPCRLARKGLLITVALFITVVLLMIGIPYYLNILAPRHRTILQVGKTSFTTQDLIKRLRLKPPEDRNQSTRIGHPGTPADDESGTNQAGGLKTKDRYPGTGIEPGNPTKGHGLGWR